LFLVLFESQNKLDSNSLIVKVKCKKITAIVVCLVNSFSMSKEINILPRMGVGRYSVALAVAWTVLVLGLYSWMGHQFSQFSLQLARSEARAYFDNAMAFRSWVAEHGGIYVPSDSAITPNKYLKAQERDIVTLSGKRLTLMNPAYVIRALTENGSNRAGVYGHLTSLKPIRPENGPDLWEQKSLLSFDLGVEEVSEVVEIDGKPHLRFMRPVYTENSCLGCHEEQGYVIGDVRGGISITEPMDRYLAMELDKKFDTGISFFILWLVGMLGLFIKSRQLKKRLAESERMAVQLVYARDEAHEADDAKSQFLATMSHELRTPLNGILGMLKLLRSGALTTEQKEYADIALSSGDNLMAIISDLLDYSRAQAGKLRLTASEFNLRSGLDAALASYADYSRTKGIEFSHTVDERLEGVYYGDEGRLRQILVNVVGNAVKFTQEGKVDIEVWSVGGDERGELILFEVRDTGIGIESDRIEYLFEPFTQADSSSTRQFPGTGMGLGIVKRLVEAMGGTITVESEPGVGTSFHFTVRLERACGSSETCEGTGAIVMRILLWSPDDSGREELALALGRMGNRAIVPASLDEFVESLEKYEYDCILVDGRTSDEELKAFAETIREREVCNLTNCNVVVYGAESAPADALFGKDSIKCCHPSGADMENLRMALVDCLLNSL